MFNCFCSFHLIICARQVLMVAYKHKHKQIRTKLDLHVVKKPRKETVCPKTKTNARLAIIIRVCHGWATLKSWTYKRDKNEQVNKKSLFQVLTRFVLYVVTNPKPMASIKINVKILRIVLAAHLESITSRPN